MTSVHMILLIFVFYVTTLPIVQIV